MRAPHRRDHADQRPDEFGYDDDGMTFEGDEAFYDGYGHDF